MSALHAATAGEGRCLSPTSPAVPRRRRGGIGYRNLAQLSPTSGGATFVAGEVDPLLDSIKSLSDARSIAFRKTLLNKLFRRCDR